MSLATITNERPSTAPPSNTFILQVDSETVSTFRTSSPFESPTEGKPLHSLTTYTSNADETTTITEMTLDSRALKMENRFDNIEQLLHVLVDRRKIDIQVTPPNISIGAGTEKSTPAHGN